MTGHACETRNTLETRLLAQSTLVHVPIRQDTCFVIWDAALAQTVHIFLRTPAMVPRTSSSSSDQQYEMLVA